ncbi:ciliary microtubule inner protein 4 isoform X2 [Heliangelus exortis]|uniref:ciliary microtubule inner protein 4 isoform X2 n=1 Tax=Heliangelus exortis TaxID=472823 RepID=UPI003A9417B7
MDEGVLEYPTSPSPDENEYVLASSSVEPEEEKKQDLGESLCPSSQKTSQKNPSKTSWKTSRGSVAQGTEKNSTFIKSQERRTLSETALIMGQKRIDDRTKMIKNPLDSPQSFADYNHLGYNLRSNIFQGGPLETRSLMKDSYTPDIIQKAIRDPKNWHGRRTDELGKWHQKNALNLSVQKALEERYGKKQSKP